MDIEKLIKLQDKLLAEATALITKRNVPPSMLTRPIASQEARMDRLKQRIETLNAMKEEQTRQIDSEIETLSTELSQLTEKIEADRKTLQPYAMRRESEPEPDAKAPGRGKKKGKNDNSSSRRPRA
ncbi:MAG: hypothetical protein ACR2KT_17430 [Methylocella sp.]|nr:MAG: hypothetical protein DLM68_01565 [Hyphomicrobiales bacterium]